MPQEEIKQIGEGRVWTGIHAQQIGLVDELGGLKEALSKAKALSKTTHASILNYPEKDDWMESLIEEMTGNSYADRQLIRSLGKYYDVFSDVQSTTRKIGIQASIPYYLMFNL